MARQIVVLALVLIALVGLVSAENDAPAKAAPKSNDTAPSSDSKGGAEAAAEPGNDDAIGNTDEAGAPTNSTGGDDDGAAVEGPIGSEDAANSAAAAQPPTSGATTLGVSALAGAAALAGYFVF